MNTHITFFSIAAFFVLFFSGCTKQTEIMPNDEKICLSASVGELSSRVENEVIESGTYYFTYNTNNGKKVSITKFENGKGYPLINVGDDTDVYQFLKWSDVKANNEKKYEFILDNVEDIENDDNVSLNDIKYQAAPITQDNNYLDIVYGKTVVDKSGSDVNLLLSHKMSKISLEIYVKSSNINLENKNATITLKNVINQPEKFDRTNGVVYVATNAIRSDIELYNGELIQDGDKYTIPSWIFPPQDFDTNNWPELEIKIENTTYTGKLTHFMVDGDEDAGTPIDMSGFVAGKHLTLRANLSNDAGDVELIFMPVWVKKWEDIGTIGITANQRGIYTVNDYEDLVDAYNSEPKKESVLSKYGTINGDKWEFILFRNIGDEETGYPKFKDGNFSINFNGYKIYGKNSNDDLIDSTSNTDGN